jgi:hypothetical protein
MWYDDPGRPAVEGVQNIVWVRRRHPNQRRQTRRTNSRNARIKLGPAERRMFGIEAQCVEVRFAEDLAYNRRRRFNP